MSMMCRSPASRPTIALVESIEIMSFNMFMGVLNVTPAR